MTCVVEKQTHSCVCQGGWDARTERNTPVAVRAVRLLSRTRSSSERSSHASEERAPHHLLILLLLSMLVMVVVVVVVAHGPRQTAVQ